jgi:hypothetical protein
MVPDLNFSKNGVKEKMDAAASIFDDFDGVCRIDTSDLFFYFWKMFISERVLPQIVI